MDHETHEMTRKQKKCDMVGPEPLYAKACPPASSLFHQIRLSKLEGQSQPQGPSQKLKRVLTLFLFLGEKVRMRAGLKNVLHFKSNSGCKNQFLALPHPNPLPRERAFTHPPFQNMESLNRSERHSDKSKSVLALFLLPGEKARMRAGLKNVLHFKSNSFLDCWRALIFSFVVSLN
ncbi:MAG TPA: hypothetical protein VGN23_01195 [Verrucomicrobiae bacterium]|jgi:hypothetical protein